MKQPIQYLREAKQHPAYHVAEPYVNIVECPGCGNRVTDKQRHAAVCVRLHRLAIQQHLNTPLVGGFVPPLVPVTDRIEWGSR